MTLYPIQAGGRRMKLSKAQREVLRLMGEGHELNADVGALNGRVWMRGGPKGIRWSTLHALADRGLIERAKKQFWYCQPYRLTEAGKKEAQG